MEFFDVFYARIVASLNFERSKSYRLVLRQPERRGHREELAGPMSNLKMKVSVHGSHPRPDYFATVTSFGLEIP